MLDRGDSFAGPDAHCRRWDYYIPIVSLQAQNKMSECLMVECLNRLICCSGDSVDAFALSASGNTAIRAESSLAVDGELLLT